MRLLFSFVFGLLLILPAQAKAPKAEFLYGFRPHEAIHLSLFSLGRFKPGNYRVEANLFYAGKKPLWNKVLQLDRPPILISYAQLMKIVQKVKPPKRAERPFLVLSLIRGKKEVLGSKLIWFAPRQPKVKKANLMYFEELRRKGTLELGGLKQGAQAFISAEVKSLKSAKPK